MELFSTQMELNSNRQTESCCVYQSAKKLIQHIGRHRATEIFHICSMVGLILFFTFSYNRVVQVNRVSAPTHLPKSIFIYLLHQTEHYFSLSRRKLSFLHSSLIYSNSQIRSSFSLITFLIFVCSLRPKTQELLELFLMLDVTLQKIKLPLCFSFLCLSCLPISHSSLSLSLSPTLFRSYLPISNYLPISHYLPISRQRFYLSLPRYQICTYLPTQLSISNSLPNSTYP